MKGEKLNSSTDPLASDIDSSNSAFWNELCGSSLARALGINDASKESLTKFDNWYFAYYSYLLPFVDTLSVNGKRTLEVGLGYGSLSQKLSEKGALYTGLDIAAGPVAMVNHRLLLFQLAGQAIEGNVLRCPFPEGTFDSVVAIGSLHHTGNFDRALRELHRVILPGGRLIFMVYNTFSYRRWLYWPTSTMRHALWARRWVDRKPVSSQSERGFYDTDQNANAAPETEFFSKSELRKRMVDWTIDEIRLNNVGDEGILRRLPRAVKLKFIAPVLGLDIYVSARKR